MCYPISQTFNEQTGAGEGGRERLEMEQDVSDKMYDMAKEFLSKFHNPFYDLVQSNVSIYKFLIFWPNS
jgi:hypothetical protein